MDNTGKVSVAKVILDAALASPSRPASKILLVRKGQIFCGYMRKPGSMGLDVPGGKQELRDAGPRECGIRELGEEVIFDDPVVCADVITALRTTPYMRFEMCLRPQRFTVSLFCVCVPDDAKISLAPEGIREQHSPAWRDAQFFFENIASTRTPTLAGWCYARAAEAALKLVER